MISNAFAQGTATASASWMEFLPLIVLFALLYFLMIRPQAKKAKEHRQLLESIQKNDEVITAGGILGKVIEVGDQYVTVEIASNTQIQVQKLSIQSVLPKGTLKATS